MSVRDQAITAEEHVKQSIIEYGTYVILDRAIPDVRDGLKPVQRRILTAMNGLGIKPNAGTLKCARIDGDTMGQYHPHGDMGIYGALCQMATPWTAKYPMIKRQGNFGSIKGAPPAAHRYTEAGFTDFGYLNFQDKKYLNWIPNFDSTTTEPEVLSAVLPTLLIQGYSGIALGFAGSIPAHDLIEVTTAALNYHRGKPFQISHPQLEQPCFLLSNDEEVQNIYKTGEGTLSYCSRYIVDEKHKKITITGYAPGVHAKTITKALKDLVAKELLEIQDFSSKETQLEITFKDTRLLKTRVLPTLLAKDSYKFYAITGETIKLFNLEGVLGAWRQHRLNIWQRKIIDIISETSQELMELKTQLAIIQNRPAFIKAIDEPNIKAIKVALTFIDPKMHDYALSLKISQILKLNEKALLEKIRATEKKIKLWKETSPEIELEKELVDMLALHQLQKMEPTVKMIKPADLPNFGKEVLTNHWAILYDKNWTVELDPPTRGRGFAGIAITQASRWFNIVDDAGYLEQYNVFKLPKKFLYEEKRQSKPLGIFGDVDGLLVCLDDKHSLHVKENTLLTQTEKQLTKSKLKYVLLVHETDKVLVRYLDGKFKIVEYNQLYNKITERAAQGYPDFKGLNNPAVSIHLIHDGNYYSEKGLFKPGTLPVGVKLFNVGKKNFVVTKAGQRLLLSDIEISSQLDQVETCYKLS